jgi:hypothetical protein
MGARFFSRLTGVIMKSFFSVAVSMTFLTLVQPAMSAEGEWWEMTTKMEMPGMPAGMAGMPGGGQTVKFCMLKGQEGKPVKSKGKEDCAISNQKQSGNTLSFNMQCPGKDAMTGSGELTYTPNSFNQKITMSSGGMDMSMVSTGKRIGGACKS